MEKIQHLAITQSEWTLVITIQAKNTKGCKSNTLISSNFENNAA
jgi:hypothetical protein